MSSSDDIAALTGTLVPRWNSAAPLGTPVFVTYTFPTYPAEYDRFKGFMLASDTHQNYMRMALAPWEESSGIRFLEVPESVGGQIRISLVDMTGTPNSVGNQVSGWGYHPASVDSPVGGDVYLNATYFGLDASSMAPGRPGFSILLHEVGHAIGFKHPFEGLPIIIPAHDSGNYTIMSYTRSLAQTTLGPVDIAAAQFLYGAADAAFAWDPQRYLLTIYGTDASEVRLGSELDDTLVGMGGDDVLNGQDGTDTAAFSGALADYRLGSVGDGTINVTDLRGGSPDGVDTLISIEHLPLSTSRCP